MTLDKLPLREAGYGLVLAIQFLTRIPVPVSSPWTPATRRWAIRCYPLVGILLGVLVALIGEALQPWVPAPLLALTILTLWVGLSGGLHLDGVMDVADALGSNAPLERRWAIMKDPHVGSFGILALLFLMLWKGALLLALIEAGVSLGLLVPLLALGRTAAVVLLIEIPAARPEGLAWAWQQDLSRRDLGIALLPLVLLLWFPGAVVMGLALVPFLWGYAKSMLRAFRGINGDIVGAAIEGGELWLLLVAWIWWSFVMV